MDATAKLVTIIAIAAFATERILAAVSYVMNAARLWRVDTDDDPQARVKEQRKFVLFIIAAVIAYVVVDRANLRLLRVLQVDNLNPVVDFWLTWLVVLAGADRVHSMLGSGGAGGGGDKGSDSNDSSDTPVVRVQIDGGEVRELHRVR